MNMDSVDIESHGTAGEASRADAPAYAIGALWGKVPPPPTPPKTYPRTVEELRVIIVTPSLFVPDGVSLTLLKLARYLRARGGHVCFLTTKPLGPAPDLPQDLDIIFAPGLAVPISGQQATYQLGAMLNGECEEEVRRFAPNVVHLSVPDWNGLGVARLANQLSAAIVMTFHSNYGDYLQFYGLGCFKFAFNTYLAHFYSHVPLLFAPTPFIKDKLTNEGIANSTNMDVWGRGVDFHLFHPSRCSEKFRSRYGLATEEVVVLWVGRLVKEKRPYIFLEVIERLNREGCPCKGLVVGTGVYEQPLSMSPYIVTAGFLSGTALATAYASSDLLLFPSTVETFGNVTLEALAAGCPVVVDSNCSGHLVKQGVNGEAVSPDEKDGYYEAVKRLVSNHTYRETCASQARDSVKDFSAEAIQEKMLNNYLEMAALNGTGAPESISESQKTESSRVSSQRLYMLWRLVFVFVYPIVTIITGIANVFALCECSPWKTVKKFPKRESNVSELRLEIARDDDDRDTDEDVETGRVDKRLRRVGRENKVRTLSADLVLAAKARSASFGLVSIFHLRDRRRILLVLALYGSLLVGMTWLMFNM